MNATIPEFHPIFTVAQTAAYQIGGTYLAEDATQAAFKVLAETWRKNISEGYGKEGPTAPEVEQMITGDIRDTIDALERLLGVIERRTGDE